MRHDPAPWYYPRMLHKTFRTIGCLTALAAGLLTACGGNPVQTTAEPALSPALPATAEPATGTASPSAIEKARADSLRRPYTEADVRFMTGMIGHHEQAILIANWAATHEASASLRVLAGRVINAQQDEIALMHQWLRERGKPLPQPGEHTAHGGQRLMPGMLSPEQLKALDAARGLEFDRLFLTFMIQHHKGAMTMVQELLGSHGAAQDDRVFKLAADINVDQATEIARMERMLAVVLFEGRAP